jgi:diadenosine tetraphosphate (Ap4A) HIT family hydrolase
VTDCWVCESTATNGVPGGVIHETARWIVDHCVGPLGIGTLIVRPKRHIIHVAGLDGEEARELGPLLQQTAAVVTELVEPDQVYVTLWSHAGGEPGETKAGHIHFVVQPVTLALVDEVGSRGAHLQSALFDRKEQPDPAAVAEFADRARAAWPLVRRTG